MLQRVSLAVLLFIYLFVNRAVAQQPTTSAQPAEESLSLASWFVSPLSRGILVRLPVIDTDPNRGITYGVMPIVVLQSTHDNRIEQIHAPSFTYNKDFGFTPTYRYYYYPTKDATVIGRGSISHYEREGLIQYQDSHFQGRDVDFFVRGQYCVDAGNRFYGLGPATSQNSQSNYTSDYYLFKLGAGMPLKEGSNWRAHFFDYLRAQSISDGPLAGLKNFSSTYPGFTAVRRQQTNEMRLTLDYDSRDHTVTTKQGALLQTYVEKAVRDFASAYDYGRYGIDTRWFRPWANAATPQVTAASFKYEQLRGNAPFWLLPQLGGKYELRAYGAGRYVDKGMAALNIEQRFTVYDKKLAGVTTEVEVSPFAGVGAVFDNPGQVTSKYLRPVVGLATRGVARPQVVGSIDVGVGQEGPAIFMDINYSF